MRWRSTTCAGDGVAGAGDAVGGGDAIGCVAATAAAGVGRGGADAAGMAPPIDARGARATPAALAEVRHRPGSAPLRRAPLRSSAFSDPPWSAAPRGVQPWLIR